jgi:hypothetical protein
MVEGHVSQDVEVQVLSSAPIQQKSPITFGDFFLDEEPLLSSVLPASDQTA